jgi:hypothetical protein
MLLISFLMRSLATGTGSSKWRPRFFPLPELFNRLIPFHQTYYGLLEKAF